MDLTGITPRHIEYMFYSVPKETSLKCTPLWNAKHSVKLHKEAVWSPGQGTDCNRAVPLF